MCLLSYAHTYSCAHIQPCMHGYSHTLYPHRDVHAHIVTQLYLHRMCGHIQIIQLYPTEMCVHIQIIQLYPHRDTHAHTDYIPISPAHTDTSTLMHHMSQNMRIFQGRCSVPSKTLELNFFMPRANKSRIPFAGLISPLQRESRWLRG